MCVYREADDDDIQIEIDRTNEIKCKMLITDKYGKVSLGFPYSVHVTFL